MEKRRLRQGSVLALAVVLLLVGNGMGEQSEATAANCIGSDADIKDPAAREAVCLRELRNRASRTGNILSLKLENGTIKKFLSNPEACKNDQADQCVNYYLVGFHPAARRYLVYVTGYEDSECRMVSTQTGKAVIFLNVPHFAPDGSTFFVGGHDNDYRDRLGIGSVALDPPALVWEMKVEDNDEWDFVRWIDNDRITIRQTLQSATCNGTCEATLKRTNSTWTLERLPPKPDAK